MNQIFNDYLSMSIQAITPQEELIAKKSNIPMFRGILYEQLDDGYGTPMLKEVSRNTVVLGGAIFALEKICNATATFEPATLNTIYEINSSTAGTTSGSTIALFGLGTGGSSLTLGEITAKNAKLRDIPELVPMRVAEELTGTDAAKYFLKKQNSDGVTYNWYLKEFASDIVIKSLWKDAAEDDADGTEVLTEVWNSTREEGIKTFAQLSINLNVSDVREYFQSINQLDLARYNTLGIYTGQKVLLSDGSYDYVNVRLFAYTNFNNKDLSLATTSSYVYRIYSAI